MIFRHPFSLSNSWTDFFLSLYSVSFCFYGRSQVLLKFARFLAHLSLHFGAGLCQGHGQCRNGHRLIAKRVNRLVLGLLWREVGGASELFSCQVESFPGLWWLSTYMFCRVCLLGIGTIKWLGRNVCYRIMAENSPIKKPSWGNSGLKAHFFRG